MNDITREDAVKWLINLRDDCGRHQDMWHYAEALDQIIELLSADVAPVRHGRWIWLGPICDKFGEVEGRAFKCSACNYVLGIYHNSEFYRYCPNCGAKMDEGEDDE